MKLLFPIITLSFLLFSSVSLSDTNSKNTENELISTLENWASKWSKQDIKGYINTYATDFKGTKSSHKEWLDYRRERILKPTFISVRLSHIHIRSISNTKAMVDFSQQFESDQFSDSIRKRIIFKRVTGQWTIIDEQWL